MGKPLQGFAHCNGVEHLVLESDSLIIINKLSSGDNDLSELGSFFSSIKRISSSLSFSHIGRNGNVLAHLLAQKKGETLLLSPRIGKGD